MRAFVLLLCLAATVSAQVVQQAAACPAPLGNRLTVVSAPLAGSVLQLDTVAQIRASGSFATPATWSVLAIGFSDPVVTLPGCLCNLGVADDILLAQMPSTFVTGVFAIDGLVTSSASFQVALPAGIAGMTFYTQSLYVYPPQVPTATGACQVGQLAIYLSESYEVTAQ